jgi:hypothetical protein
MNAMKKECHLIFFALTVFFVAAFSVSAQDFEVSPVVLDFQTEPGNSETRKVLLLNHSNKRQAFEFKLFDYVVDTAGKKINKPAGTTKRSCAEWISINPSFVEMNPNERIEVEVLMSVPKNEYSTRWGAIAVQATQEKKGFEVDKVLATGIVITPRIIIAVSQSPKSNSNYRAVIDNFREVTAVKDSLRTFKAEVANLGDKVVKGKVFLTLADITTAEEQNFEPTMISVLPDNKTTVTLKLPAGIKKGKYALAAILDYGHNTPLEGVQTMIDIQ